jgi:2-aminobenzoate-CoA ligase
MQENVPESYLPEDGPQLIHPLPDLHYPEEINVAAQLVDRHVKEGRGNNVAIRFGDEAITYAELRTRVNRLGNALLTQGVEPGDRVVVRFTNRPEAVVSCLAAQKIGAVALPSMKLLRAKELVHIIDNAEASTVIVYDDLLDEINEALPDLDTVDNVVVVQRNGIDHDHADYDDLTAAADDELDARPTTRDDLALMLYTSGTTGQPKGATHTHRQVLATADSYAKYCLNASEADVFGGNPPLPFAYGYGDLLTFPLRFGATTSLVENADPGDLLEAVENHGVTILCSIPTAFNQILSEFPDGHEEYDTSSLRLAVSAGEPLTHSTFNRFKNSYDVEIYDGIGTTEMLHIFVSHRESQDIDPGATGYPVPGYECKVVDPDSGEEMPRGEPGLLAVRGPTGISYWDRPDKQAAALVDGWSLPGDIYVHREDDRLEYKSREDDLIISSGYNIPGPEVEAVVEEREEVSEVAVIGAPDEERGQIVKGFVVPVESATASEDLTETIQTHVKNTLAPYKYPRAVEYVDELPRTETGKIQRVKLRERERNQYEE